MASSISVALSIRKALSGYTKGLKGPKLLMFNSFSSFIACSTAGCLNAFFMRKTELEKGIDIKDSDGNVVGKSKVAAKIAIMQTAISRYVLAVPIFMPATALYGVERLGMMPRSFYATTMLEILFIALELMFAVPLAIAVYPQTATIKASEIEAEFRELKNLNGELVREFTFNKGL